MVEFLNDKLEEDDELTSTKLNTLLMQNWPDLNVSIDTIRRCHRTEGWVCTRPHYCQLIRHINKRKRVVWCKKEIKSKDDFANTIFSDKYTVQLEQHGRLFLKKETTEETETAAQASTKASYLGSNIISRCLSGCHVHRNYGCSTLRANIRLIPSAIHSELLSCWIPVPAG